MLPRDVLLMQHTVAKTETFQRIGKGFLATSSPNKIFRGLSGRIPTLQAHAGVVARMSYSGFKFEVFGKASHAGARALA